MPPEHTEFVSIVQVELQPSPSAVFLSSHSSLLSLSPSPQSTTQTAGDCDISPTYPEGQLDVTVNGDPDTCCLVPVAVTGRICLAIVEDDHMSWISAPPYPSL